jgi:hypothetical protein
LPDGPERLTDDAAHLARRRGPAATHASLLDVWSGGRAHQGQGYIVHAVMMASRYGWLAWVVIGLMVVQIVLALVQIWQAL